MLACALVLVMVCMWVRVLFGHKPGPAAAGPRQTRAASEQPSTSARITPVELPKLPGRHDTIGRNFFSLHDSAYFQSLVALPSASTDPEVRVASPDDAHEVIQRVAQTLRLEAVYWSESEEPRAFINNQLLAQGQILTVESVAGSFDFDVVKISENSVLVSCQDEQVTLKLLNVEVRERSSIDE